MPIPINGQTDVNLRYLFSAQDHAWTPVLLSNLGECWWLLRCKKPEAGGFNSTGAYLPHVFTLPYHYRLYCDSSYLHHHILIISVPYLHHIQYTVFSIQLFRKYLPYVPYTLHIFISFTSQIKPRMKNQNISKSNLTKLTYSIYIVMWYINVWKNS